MGSTDNTTTGVSNADSPPSQELTNHLALLHKINFQIAKCGHMLTQQPGNVSQAFSDELENDLKLAIDSTPAAARIEDTSFLFVQFCTDYLEEQEKRAHWPAVPAMSPLGRILAVSYFFIDVVRLRCSPLLLTDIPLAEMDQVSEEEKKAKLKKMYLDKVSQEQLYDLLCAISGYTTFFVTLIENYQGKNDSLIWNRHRYSELTKDESFREQLRSSIANLKQPMGEYETREVPNIMKMSSFLDSSLRRLRLVWQLARRTEKSSCEGRSQENMEAKDSEGDAPMDSAQPLSEANLRVPKLELITNLLEELAKAHVMCWDEHGAAYLVGGWSNLDMDEDEDEDEDAIDIDTGDNNDREEEGQEVVDLISQIEELRVGSKSSQP